MPSCELVDKAADINQRVVHEDVKHCHLPSYLPLLGEMLQGVDQDTVQFFEQIWPALQLRFKYCRLNHANTHLPGTYRWNNEFNSRRGGKRRDQRKTELKANEFYTSHLDLNIWMAYFAKTLNDIENMLKE